ncbi:MAG: hypothetical protein AAF384_07305 [Pseudomonadota bacterium]
MSPALLLLIAVITAILIFFRQGTSNNARAILLIGFLLVLGACLGSLTGLDAETGGNDVSAGGVDSLVWWGMFVAGAIAMIVGFVAAMMPMRPSDRGDNHEQLPPQ